MFDIEELYERQFAIWPLARENYRRLADCDRMTVGVGGESIVVQYNPARIRSSAADISKDAIARRRCFLCAENRPQEQISLDCGEYEILVNPYPVFDRHLTIAFKRHEDQRIVGRVRDMIGFAKELPDMTVFYNGPRSGASAPDHLHFQAVPSAPLPLWSHPSDWSPVKTIVVSGTDGDEVAQRIEGALWNLRHGEEPDVNLYVRSDRKGFIEAVIIPRKAHRPSCYGQSSGQALISPASVEMAGVIIAPREADFAACSDSQFIRKIYEDCGYSRCEIPEISERILSVGIVKAEKLDLRFHGAYSGPFSSGLSDRDISVRALPDGHIEFDGRTFGKEIIFSAAEPQSSFTIRDVMIGIGFHWQQHENQSFHGDLSLRWRDGMLQAVNLVPLETYLRSVVSSEMNAAAPEEFLKAHAVISRSWVLAQIEPPLKFPEDACRETPEETVRWYDHEAHTDFDVCADDHCQRYQGCTKASTPQVESALEATRGEVLAFGYDLCDARFSKCCGGKTELFSTCWQPVDPLYLPSIDDPYCGRASKEVLSTVLNNYDLVTDGYYRWTVTYTAEELRQIIKDRTGMDYGDILEIVPLHRGPSGRIDRLRIQGALKDRIIGKELEIRRTLSPSHLYSSAFTVESGAPDLGGVPRSWTFCGSGWGHGVGLCQIGAAVMAAEGHGYRDILNFYFPGTRLIKLY